MAADRGKDLSQEITQVLAEVREFAAQRRTRQSLGLLGPNPSVELLERVEAALESAREALQSASVS